MPSVASLHVYPIKSCRGLDLTAVRCDALGPLYDRRFMLVDEQGDDLTQRVLPRMALISPRLGPTSLVVSAPDMPQLKVAMTARDARELDVQIWGERVPAEDVGEHAADWFSRFLERPVRLVRWAEHALRPVSQQYTRTQAAVGFADGFPLLLMNEASVADLNARIAARGGTAVPMNRFRPNLVVRDCEPYAEDGWRRIRVGELVLDVVKPCGRCAITTTDQRTGERGKEPLATLAEYRTHEQKIDLGQNCVHLNMGSVRVGDTVEIMETA